MRIKKETLYKIITMCPETPFEIGGIIGETSGVICEVLIDNRINEYGKYTPDTEMINRTIFSWSKKNINFKGIFHSHYPCNNSLSQGDIEYIKKIMISVNKFYSHLYFPIVIPQKNITVYKAEVKHNKLRITNDELTIID